MAYETINHTCGHETRVQLYGKHADRDRRAAVMASEPCPRCRARLAAEQDAAEGLAELRGSAKQIAWASDIRAASMRKIDSTLILRQMRAVCLEIVAAHDRETLEAAGKRLGIQDQHELTAIVRDRLATIGSARWWIDRRDADAAAHAVISELYTSAID